MRRDLPIILLAFPLAAAASISAEYSHLTVSSDGHKLLVMRSPRPDGPVTVTLPDGRTLDPDNTFPKSGVYDAATLAPLWQVDWYAQKWDLQWSDDVRFVARRNRFGVHSHPALSFFDQGRLIKCYDCAQLLTGMEAFIPFSTGDYHYRWYEDFATTDDHQQLALSTARHRINIADHVMSLGLQEFYTFDLATGAMTSRRSTGRWVIWAYAATATIVLVTAVRLLRLCIRPLWQRARSLSRRRGFDVLPATRPPAAVVHHRLNSVIPNK